MAQTIFIGIAAGLAAALLFLSPASGTFLAFPLFALTGLPIAIVGLGWGFVAAGVAALAGAAVIFVAFPSSLTGLVFLALFGVPMVWLTRLAGFSRVPEGTGAAREWFPLSRLLLHTTLAAALGIVCVGFLSGYTSEGMVADATVALSEALAQLQSTAPPPTTAELEPLVRLYVALLPFLTAILMLAITVFNLWLAAIVARASSRLQRPADRFSMVTLPNEILAGFVAAALLAFLPGAFGEIGAVFAGAFAGGLMLIGLAVLHVVTTGMGGRTPLLVVVYTLIILSGLPIVILALLGAGDTFLHMRARRLSPPSKPD